MKCPPSGRYSLRAKKKKKKGFVANQNVPCLRRFVAGLSMLRPETNQAMPWFMLLVAGLSLLRFIL
jgi:hypothetical protein